MIHNPNAERLRQILFEQIKEVIMKGGMELYNKLVDDIERCNINDDEELAKRLLKK